MKKTQIEVTLTSSKVRATLDLDVLLAMSIEEQRAMLRALNRDLGPYDAEQCNREYAAWRQQNGIGEMPTTPEQTDLLFAYHREVFVPRFAQLTLAENLARAGRVKGQREAAAGMKEHAAGTWAKIEPLRHLPPRVIAERLDIDRSTVARHLKAHSKPITSGRSTP